MAVSKNSKVANKSSTQKVKLVLSNDCEACTTPCARGMNYVERIKNGKSGNGVVCQK